MKLHQLATLIRGTAKERAELKALRVASRERMFARAAQPCRPGGGGSYARKKDRHLWEPTAAGLEIDYERQAVEQCSRCLALR